MRLWAEERKSGSIELLMTQPVTLWEAVLGKFFAAWIFSALALALTFPLWITVNYLGSPDNGAILAAYVGSLLLAGGFLAIGSCMSALTRNQVVAFILRVVACASCFCWPASRWCSTCSAAGRRRRSWTRSPRCRSSPTSSRSQKGVIDVRDLLYFAMLIGVLPARDRDRARRAQSGLEEGRI
jgi:ABC-2 type transport system permease protein